MISKSRKIIKSVLLGSMGLCIVAATAQAGPTSFHCDYSNLIYSGSTTSGSGINNSSCDIQNGIVGSPNSATSLMFQQDFEMSDPAIDLDSFSEEEQPHAADSPTSPEKQTRRDSALKSSAYKPFTVPKPAFLDAVYRPGNQDQYAFIPMNYRSNSKDDYRFITTSVEGQAQAEAALSAAKSISLAAVNATGLGASYSGVGHTDAVTLPIDYRIRFKNGYGLSLNLPFSYIQNKNTTNFDNSSSTSPYWSASLGLGFKIPLSRLLNMKNVWALTLLGRFGGVDAINNNDKTSALIYSGGLLSEYDMRLAGGVLGIKNMLSYYGTASETESLQSFIFTPPGTFTPVYGMQTNHIDSGIFRNGFYYSHYLGPQFFGRKLSGTIFFTDTRITVSPQYSALYMDNMQQVGFNFGLAPKRSKTGSFMRRALDAQDLKIGVTYTTAELPQNKTRNIDGFAVNFGFTF